MGAFGEGSEGGIPIKKIAVSILVLVFGLWILWFTAVPESWIAGRIQAAAQRRGLGVELTSMRKGYLFNLRAERAVITATPRRGQANGRPLLNIQNLAVAPDLTSFLKFSPALDLSATAGQGRIIGVLSGQQGEAGITMRGDGLDLGSVPALTAAGVYGEGTISFNLRQQAGQGKISFAVDRARMSGHLAGLDALPLGYFHTVRGVFTLGNTITVSSLTLEGEGIYVRLKGTIKAGTVSEGRAEVMLNSAFKHYGLFQEILDRYKVSPGYYVVPLAQGNP